MTVRAALFDLDGTLVDSLGDITDAVNHMLASFGRPSLAAPSVRQLVGKGARDLVRRALGTGSQDDITRALDLFVAYNSNHIADKSALYPGAWEALHQLAESGIRMAVISNKNEALCRLVMEALGIVRQFEIICGGDTFSEMKPSPLPLLRVVERLGVAPHEAVMIGDSINDVQAGQRAGVTTIGCAWGYGGEKELTGADHRAVSFRGVTAILLKGSA
ncbi:HAD-IIIA family hydrolase [Oryzomonas japonica]|uniref:phosphoglycolate phosphatase n=1 Tax=Oryzomonas japonica TaxID=2603858 RepID=A0A7J4ZLZ9_9BACT|nr:HAD-IIIA family hydrolase [Oryzomonas japonica]KAB0663676.1 HAD-IIIA family hydrolase [Oryzomonas japonica]